MLVQDRSDSSSTSEISKPALGAVMRVSTRDLRAVDPAYPRVLPQILVREHGMLLKLESIRAVITADSVRVFDPLNPSVQTFLAVLHDRLRTEWEAEVPSDQPFEFRVLEQVLDAVVCVREPIALCSSVDLLYLCY